MDIGNNNAECVAFDETYGLTYPTVSGTEGGGNAVNSTYGIPAYPTVILIAPDHSIVIQDLWPIPNAQTIINALENYPIQANECGSSTLTASFTADNTAVCLTNQVQFTNSSSGDITTYAWTFEGGDPATSSDENPLVTYNTTGTFNVSLTVSNDTETANVDMDDYITVSSIEAAFTAEETDICNETQVQFLDNSSCDATSWVWTFEGGDPASSTEQNPVVTYATSGSYSVTLVATNANGNNEINIDNYMTVHNCTGVEYLSAQSMRIAPNPNNGRFQITLPGNLIYRVFVYDVTGHLVNESNISAGENSLDISHLESGVYLINADNGSIQYKERLIIE